MCFIVAGLADAAKFRKCSVIVWPIVCDRVRVRVVIDSVFDLAIELPKCHFGDAACLTKTIDTYVRSYKHGMNDAHITSIDPLFVKEVDIIQGNDSPVNINLNFKNVNLTGLSNLRATKVM